MTDQPLACVILAAGKGTRINSELPKVLHPVAGRPMLGHVLTSATLLNPERTVVVLGPEQQMVCDYLPEGVRTALQQPQLGTGHAVLAARAALADCNGDLLVLYGDCPLIRPDTLSLIRARRAGRDDPAVVVLGFRPDDPAAYGRLIMSKKDKLTKIVEFNDATAEEKAIGLCNSGVMLIDGAIAFSLLAQIGNDNAKGEYYLTDCVALACAAGRECVVVEADPDEVLGVNDRVDLAVVEAAFQARARQEMMHHGVSLQAPETVFFSWDTQIEADVSIGPNVVFGPGVSVERGARIEAFCHLEGAHIARGAVIGPFARLRPGTEIGARAKVGNFVEVKKAYLGPGAKANHLSYLGDARIGSGANVGAGTITCNYDGFNKHHTEIGAGAFIGSNTALVAPVKVGDGALIGAGSTITKDVDEDALAVERSEQRAIDGAAKRFREKNQKGGS